MLRALIELGADVNMAMDNGATPLFIAAQVGHEAVVRALIELGADVNKARHDGMTPLFMAATMATRRCCERCSRRARTSTRQWITA